MLHQDAELVGLYSNTTKPRWNRSMYAIDAASSFKGGGFCSNPKLSDERVDGLIEVNCKLKSLENLANSLELAERLRATVTSRE